MEKNPKQKKNEKKIYIEITTKRKCNESGKIGINDNFQNKFSWKNDKLVHIRKVKINKESYRDCQTILRNFCESESDLKKKEIFWVNISK